MTKVKICGINEQAGLDAAVEAGADWVGFVFFPASPRYIMLDAAERLATRAACKVPIVGLFVKPSFDQIAQTVQRVPLAALQIYGSAATLPDIRKRFGLPIWRALGVSDASDLPAEAEGADRLVVEAKPPAGADRPGGNGVTFDWRMLRGWQSPAPWILAGGLTVQNIEAAITATGTQAVDVSSGVEEVRGVKSPSLIRAFIKTAKAV